MEMEKVPAAGYPIVGLPIAGLQRRRWWKNGALPFKLWKSLRKARQVIKEHRPAVVVGVGGYASAPLLWMAQRRGIPTLIQEQNSYAGLANKLLARRARVVCVAYEGMERFFPKEKIVMTGNPIYHPLSPAPSKGGGRGEEFPAGSPPLLEGGRAKWKGCILITGGSLGARTLNQAMIKALPQLINSNIRVIWQTGKAYYEQAVAALHLLPIPLSTPSEEERTYKEARKGTGERCEAGWWGNTGISVHPFLTRMDLAYAAADIVIARAGAGTISELCAAGKATIFVPSPNVAEDHQTKNAQALVARDAALLVPDDEAIEKLLPTALSLLEDKARIATLERNISALAKPYAADGIVDEIMKLVKLPAQPPVPQRGSIASGLSASPSENREPERVYFLGIGGIGMSALARYYKYTGAQVAGYDRTPSPLTAELEREGMEIHYTDDVQQIPPAFTASPAETLVIYTPALPADHSELAYFRQQGYTVVKRSEALGRIAATKTTIAVAGTHGKSTISTLLAHLLTQAGGGCTAFLGGIAKNYHTNLLLSDAPVIVTEADEFDRSFLRLFPQIAVITATDADHLDIYGTPEAMKQAFADFARQIQPGGALIMKLGIELDLPPTHHLPLAPSEGGGACEGYPVGTPSPSEEAGARRGVGDTYIYRYSLDRPCDFYASNIRRMDNGHSRFDLHLLDTVLPDCTLGVPGRMNIENAVAAAAAAYLYLHPYPLPRPLPYPLPHPDLPPAPSEGGGAPMGNPSQASSQAPPPSEGAGRRWGAGEKWAAALASFSGVQRRFDVHLNTPRCTYIDDYAHHPEELRAAISSLREMFPQRSITGIFQPHLYTRTRDFADGFAESLSRLDALLLLDIYPAREAPIAGVSSQLIFDRVTLPNKRLCTKSELLSLLEAQPVDVLVTFGAGDIDRLVPSIMEWLTAKNNE
jgi:UDP-N-acetylmuramate--alanine ligase